MNKIIVNDKTRFQRIQAEHSKLPQIECPLIHRFTPGMYIREIFMPAGVTVTSKCHKTEHPFFITQGSVLVWKVGEEPVRLTAPHTGITLPGTQRLIFVESDCIWVTCHLNPNDEKDLLVLEDQIIEKEINPFLESATGEKLCHLQPQQQ